MKSMVQSLKLIPDTGNLAVQALALNVYCRIVCQFAENEQNSEVELSLHFTTGSLNKMRS